VQKWMCQDADRLWTAKRMNQAQVPKKAPRKGSASKPAKCRGSRRDRCARDQPCKPVCSRAMPATGCRAKSLVLATACSRFQLRLCLTFAFAFCFLLFTFCLLPFGLIMRLQKLTPIHLPRQSVRLSYAVCTLRLWAMTLLWVSTQLASWRLMTGVPFSGPRRG
jgi:hypothetical protein